ncbi:ER lumen protein retaining receptor - like 1 [Theobroma cacao]|nr:ER lumen protein retaining receptor - like 1 [Theobroma cacao]
MNIFRLAGDMTHLASVLVLLLKIHTIKSCAGISLKTQELYAIVFASRYLDIFTDFISLYNTSMKLIFLGSSFSIVWYMRRHKIVRRSYDKDQDTFRHCFLLLPCLLLALLFNEKFTFKEVMWTFSLYLEAVAILPQLVLLQRTRNIDNLTGQYVFLLGAYRGLYILNWIYRYFTEPHYVHWIRKSFSLYRQGGDHGVTLANIISIFLVMLAVASHIISLSLILSCLWQLGFLGSFRHLFMLTFSTITLTAGRTTKSSSCRLDFLIHHDMQRISISTWDMIIPREPS